MSKRDSKIVGHLIAGSPTTGLAYIVPFPNLLDSVGETLGGEWSTWNDSLNPLNFFGNRSMPDDLSIARIPSTFTAGIGSDILQPQIDNKSLPFRSNSPEGVKTLEPPHHQTAELKSGHLTISKALDLIRDDRAKPLIVTKFLERTDHEIWTKIQLHPTTYVMNQEEHDVLIHFKELHKDHPDFKPAIARFLETYKGDPAQLPQGSDQR
ncbi:uncharacterized protein KY384_003941 [Bacidia gigantensis]|uniref:uncharacterized protein n=1 Tax=Bacidia gigantensis TaxID=2732470 RepID=UPI001D0453DD|nr:uncharacterized protein KY384_003941 [Bacidia gigantensis]KAG8532300.1 hypothetical protein KY384_003941 [Bacidia gigantensis]